MIGSTQLPLQTAGDIMSKVVRGLTDLQVDVYFPLWPGVDL
jgi:hypothetical protein